MKPTRFCIDWDGTLVEDAYPDQGPWLPGAVEALHRFDQMGTVVVFSCRTSDYQFPTQVHFDLDVPRDPVAVSMELERMSAMLTKVGLGHLEIWTRPYKPPATVYIDNRAVGFRGNWQQTFEEVLTFMSEVPEYDVQIPGQEPLWASEGEVEARREEEGEAVYVVGDELYVFDREVTEQLRELLEPYDYPAAMEEACTVNIESVTASAPPARHPNSQRFHDLLEEAGRLHDQKQQDYGRGDDPFANVRASEEWGVESWVGAMVRATDKVRRLQTYAQTGSLANEGVIDSLMDLAVYALIARVLFEQEQGE